MSVMQPIAQALGAMLAPLLLALEDEDSFTLFLQTLGWDTKLAQGDFATISSLLPLAEDLTDLLETVAAFDTEMPGEVIEDVVSKVDAIFQTIQALQSVDLQRIKLLPSPLNTLTFWAAFALDVPEYLVIIYLEGALPPLYALLLLGGVIEIEVTEDDPPRTLRHLNWSQLTGLLQDSAAHIAALYGWGGELAQHVLLERLAFLASTLGLTVERVGPPASLVDRFYPERTVPFDLRQLNLLFHDGLIDNVYVRAGFLLLPIPRAGETSVSGLYLSNLLWGDLSTVDLSPVEIEGNLDASGAVGLRLQPGEPPQFEGTAPEINFALKLNTAPTEPYTLFGKTNGTRLLFSGYEIELRLQGAINQPEFILRAACVGDGLQVIVVPSEGDNFLRALLGETELAVGAEIDIEWSSKDGFQLAGGAEFDITFPLNLRLFFVTILELHLSLGISAEGVIAAQADIDVSAVLGPFALTVGDIGVIATVVPSEDTTARGTFGGLEIGWAFKPPTSLGFTLDIAGIVTGGGFVYHDPLLGRYAGALALDFLAVGLAAVVVVDTQLPGNPDGWALFASVSATFPSIPLGFGFFLSGVGGIVCLNRTMDTEALVAGLREGAIDALLFPDDPLVDAPLIITQLDAWFSQAEGSTVFGVAVTITWGTPKALITGELGVMLSFPDLNLALVGSISMALSDEEHALLELHMDTLGTVDVAAATVLVVASLYDSSLLGTIQLSGDMAMYSQFGAEPYFLLSVGGYHPNFHPPGYLPASVLNLRRMGCELTLSEDVWFKLENYVAVTSNTLQFGAKATLEASARFLGVTYVATGKVGFDVLLVFSPFSFAADLHASVTVSAKDTELLAVSLTAHLVGPQPWYLSGHARFEFLGIGVRFDLLVGAAANVQPPPRMPVRDAVVAALAVPEAWRPVAPAGQTVLLANDTTDDSIVRVRPDANLEAVQTAAPLERTLDIYGIYAIDGPNLLHIQGAGIEGATQVTWAAVTDWFAPALYGQMNQVDKIAAPSYEQMSAGVRLSAGGMSWGDETQSVTPDYEVRVLNEDATQPLSRQPLLGTLASVTAGLVLDRMRRPGLPRTVTGLQPFTLAAPSWTLIDATTGIASGTPATYPTVLNQLRNRTANDPTAHSRLRLAPVHATREAA